MFKKSFPERFAVSFALADFAVEIPNCGQRKSHGKPLRGCLLGYEVEELGHYNDARTLSVPLARSTVAPVLLIARTVTVFAAVTFETSVTPAVLVERQASANMEVVAPVQVTVVAEVEFAASEGKSCVFDPVKYPLVIVLLSENAIELLA